MGTGHNSHSRIRQDIHLLFYLYVINNLIRHLVSCFYYLGFIFNGIFMFKNIYFVTVLYTQAHHKTVIIIKAFI